LPDVALPLESTIREDFGAETLQHSLGFCSTNTLQSVSAATRFVDSCAPAPVATSSAAARATLRIAPKLIAPASTFSPDLSRPVLFRPPYRATRTTRSPLDDPASSVPSVSFFRLADTAATHYPPM